MEKLEELESELAAVRMDLTKAAAQRDALIKRIAGALRELRKVKHGEDDMTYVMLCIGRAEALLALD